MPRSSPSEVRRFHRVALQRLEDAEILLANDRTTAAMYLAGYAVECSLKALLLAAAPRARHPQILKSFYGKIGHDLEWLRRELRRHAVILPAEVARHLRRVANWSTDLRYEAGRRAARETRVFLEATAQVLQWVEGRL